MSSVDYELTGLFFLLDEGKDTIGGSQRIKSMLRPIALRSF